MGSLLFTANSKLQAQGKRYKDSKNAEILQGCQNRQKTIFNKETLDFVTSKTCSKSIKCIFLFQRSFKSESF